MNILASPLLWICAILYFVFFRKGSSNQFGTGSGYTTPLPGGTISNPNGSTTILPTLTNAKADSIALQLREELGNFITDDAVVVGLFKGLNDADFVMVSNSFGYMTRDLLTQSEGGFLGTNRDLIWWLIDELNSSSLAQLKKQFPRFL